MRLDKASKAYKIWVSQSKSKLTAKNYMLDVNRFIQFIGPKKDSSEITALDVSSFQDSLRKERGWKPRSINRVGYALISFLETLGRTDIAHLVPTPIYEAKIPKWLLEDKVVGVIGHAHKLLDKALLTVGYELAMRRGELPLLNLSWHDAESRTMKVRRLKHKGASPPTYVLPMREWACNTLNEYLESRQDRCRTTPLFVTHYGGKWRRIHKDTILDIYHRVASRARVKIPFHAFTKHSRLTNYAIAMIEEKGQTDLTVLAKFAGHKNPASTLLYTHLATQYLLQKPKEVAT